MLYSGFHRGSGGIGRRASLRSWWPKGRRGSSPFFRRPSHNRQCLSGFGGGSRDREVGNSQVWSAKIAEGWKKCTAVNTVNKSDARILPRAGIAWLALVLAASLCFAQDPSKAERDVQPAVLIHQVPPDYPAA